MEDRIIKIETDISYLQGQIAELNEIVADQQILVAKLQKQNEFLAKKLEELDAPERPSRRPPHY